MSGIIASYFALLAGAMTTFFFFVNKALDKPTDRKEKKVVLYVYFIIWAFIAGFSTLAYQIYTL